MSRILIGLIVIVVAACSDTEKYPASADTPTVAGPPDVIDLAGVRPGEKLAVIDEEAVARSPMPFAFLGIPTRLPALAAIFPSGELYALKDGVVAGIRWERAYATERECQSAVESTRILLQPYFPKPLKACNAWPCQFHSADGTRGIRFSCRENEGRYHEARAEFVHFETEERLSQLQRAPAAESGG